MYARSRSPIAPRTRASRLACSLPPLHPTRAPEHSSPRPLRTWQDASSFNQPLDWDVAQVTNMEDMFHVSPGRCPIAPGVSGVPDQICLRLDACLRDSSLVEECKECFLLLYEVPPALYSPLRPRRVPVDFCPRRRDELPTTRDECVFVVYDDTRRSRCASIHSITLLTYLACNMYDTELRSTRILCGTPYTGTDGRWNGANSPIDPWQHGHEGGAERGGRRVYSPD